jgi:hypothetical protein
MDRLPELRDVPEGLDDAALIAFIAGGFHTLKESQPGAPPVFDFPGAISWLFKIVLTRADDKAQVLYRCGIVLLNPVAAISPGVLSKVFACSSETVSRKVKGWAAANWDTDAKQALLSLYDRAADSKNWVFRVPPRDSVFYRFSVFRPMEQIRQRVPEANALPPPPRRSPMLLNLDRLRARGFTTGAVASVRPEQWAFNPEPLLRLDFRPEH